MFWPTLPGAISEAVLVDAWFAEPLVRWSRPCPLGAADLWLGDVACGNVLAPAT